jgi:hypothetical protein
MIAIRLFMGVLRNLVLDVTDCDTSHIRREKVSLFFPKNFEKKENLIRAVHYESKAMGLRLQHSTCGEQARLRRVNL